MRSRTGCLTCRTRKLKCDEQKPQCFQCRRAKRTCRPSEGVVFRHQQNASMNKDYAGSSSRNSRRFYSYKDTFDKDSVWLDIPKRVIFVDNWDPSVQKLESVLAEQDVAFWANSRTNGLAQIHPFSAGDSHCGLEILSAAASNNSFALPHIGASHQLQNTIPSSFVNILAPIFSGSYSGQTHSMASSDPLSTSVTPSKINVSSPLRPSQFLPLPANPGIKSTSELESLALAPVPAILTGDTAHRKAESEVETVHEGAFLLRHFSEAPGLWMDLYDSGTYFASHVPVKALANPLLKYAACAYAAKQLGRVKGVKAPTGGVCSKQAAMEIWPNAKSTDWSWYGAKYYEKAIQLLVKELQPDREGPSSSTSEESKQWNTHPDTEGRLHDRRRGISNSQLSNGAHSDEVLAATAILSIYEFLDATDPAWSRHLSGVKSLLDVSQAGIAPLEQLPLRNSTFTVPRRLGLSKARKAAFWNFARQDYIAAFINETRTRLDTEDLALWAGAGLKLDSVGFVRTSIRHTSGYSEGDDTMGEDLICNALVWILSKIVNFISSVKNSPVNVDKCASLQILSERWHRLQAELHAWYGGLPDTFRPCARVGPPQLSHQTTRSDNEALLIPEIWHTIPMCGSAMQHYHMAQILLLVCKPQVPVGRLDIITSQHKPYRPFENDIYYHSREILGISLSRPDGSVRIHSLQPLFVSGQYLTDTHERRTVIRLLRDIEADLGWATEYRVNQLLKRWNWNDIPDNTTAL